MFLAEIQLPFRGSLDNFEDVTGGHSGLFLSLLNYTIKKDPELAKIIKHILRNTSYTRGRHVDYDYTLIARHPRNPVRTGNFAVPLYQNRN